MLKGNRMRLLMVKMNEETVRRVARWVPAGVLPHDRKNKTVTTEIMLCLWDGT